MQDIKRKIKRVEPVTKTRKQQVDQEAKVLAEIRNHKVEVVTAMKEAQQKYMNGVDQLNQIRESGRRDNLDALESGLDMVKSQWYQLFQQARDIEQKETEQVQRLTHAQRDLKAIEKLSEKYQDDLKKAIAAQDQKILDETALRSFMNRRS